MEERIIAEKYRVESLIGSGGMANVYKAFDMVENRTVALKMLKEEHKEDAEFLRRFEREARAVLTLSHPNIVQSYDVGEDENNVPYIALEYVGGQTLKEYIKSKGCLQPKEAVAIASQVLDALEHAHECGIIHRDVKPQNVLLTKDNTVKLADFGIAREAGATTRTFAGTNVIGSVHYISPEQARGENVTAESDIYSCAVMVYEMITGTVPFAGDNTVAIALKHLQEEMIPPIEIDSKISRALSDVVMKGAAKEAELRYPTAAAMKKDLLRALVEPHGRFARLNRKKASKKESEHHRHDRIPLYVATAVAVGIFAMVFFAFHLFGGKDDEGLLVPALVGKNLEDARSLADLRGFNLVVSDYVISTEYPTGQVTKQSPMDGAKGKDGDTITVEVSSGSGYAIVPDLLGRSIQEASILLSEESLNMGNVDYDPTSSLPPGTIVRQEPTADTRVQEFECVNIWISGAETKLVEVPPLTGKTTEEAMMMLESSGLKQIWIRPVSPENSATGTEVVIQQSPAANMSVAEDTLTEVWISRSKPGSYSSDIAINLDIENGDKLVTVTAVMHNGIQVVLHESTVKEGLQQPISFTAFLRSAGEYKCIVYADGVEMKRITANFVLR